MKSIFTGSYKYKQSAAGNNLEDYVTELFASLIEKDAIYRQKVLKEFGVTVKLEEYVEVSTQVLTMTGAKPDMQLEIPSQETIVIIENKVESKEGSDQLYKYLNVLAAKPRHWKKVLVYLTKYIEIKDTELILNRVFHDDDIKSNKVRFQNCKWSNIYALSKECSVLAKEFALFLENMKITMENNFTHLDALTLENFGSVFDKLDQVLNASRDHHKITLDIALEKGKSISGIKSNGYFALGEKGELEFVIGFMDTPTKLVYKLQGDRTIKDKFEALGIQLNKGQFQDGNDWKVRESGSQVFLERSKGISEFMASENEHLDQMVAFIKESIDALKKHVENI